MQFMLKERNLSSATIYAADGGAAHALTMGLLPESVFGDFDSLSPSLQNTLTQKHIPCLRFPRAKDLTDGEIAVQAVKWQPNDEAWLIGALSENRPDHQQGNMALATRLASLGVKVILTDGKTFIFRLSGKSEMRLDWSRDLLGKPDIVSLLSPDFAENVTSSGLAYPLCGVTIKSTDVFALSNCPCHTAQSFHVQVASGRLDVYVLYTDGLETTVIPNE